MDIFGQTRDAIRGAHFAQRQQSTVGLTMSTSSTALARRTVLSRAAALSLVALSPVVTPTVALADKGGAALNPSAIGDVLSAMDETVAMQYVGSSFEFWNSAGRASAVLTAVQTNHRTRPAQSRPMNEASTHSFMLSFVIDESTQATPADLCHVIHPKLGAFDLFVVPSVNSEGQQVLLATFTRL